MPECHRCDHDGRCDPRCLRCKGPPDSNHKGRTFISFDAGSGKLTRHECVSDAGQTFGEVLASTEAIYGYGQDALDPDQSAERETFEEDGCVDVGAGTGCDPHSAYHDQVAGLETDDPVQGTEPEPDSPLEMARKLAYVFTELTTEEFELVRRLMRGENMSDVGRTSGVTRAAVSARVRTLARKHPAFRFLRHGKSAPPPLR